MKTHLPYFLLGCALGAGAILLLSHRYTVTGGMMGDRSASVPLFIKLDRLTGHTWKHVPTTDRWTPLREDD